MSINRLNVSSDLDEYLEKSKDHVLVLHFTASFGEQRSSQINDVLNEVISNKSSFGPVEAVLVDVEKCKEISDKYAVASVPTCLIVVKGKEFGRIEGINVSALTKKVKEAVFKNFPVNAPGLPGTEGESEGKLEDRLKKLINQAKVMIFMKGSRDAPRCKFSRELIGILQEEGADYETFDILEDEQVRQGLKAYSNWPTFPQIYVNSSLVGGLDIIKELREIGELKSTLLVSE
ncbi:glutaredoxin 3-like [Panonychus citri]|uniref:glutaredoxin 3-like n=1 Tax=Panonychus citri TaxID=50023 RepID=UPI0023072368|nr:glutaredoxin 3-like [Panonychus citri]